MRHLLVAAGLVGAVLVYLWLDREAGIRTYLELREAVARTDHRIVEAGKENAALRAEARALAEDPAAQERAIREDLDLVKPGESLVRLPPPGQNSAIFLTK